jgi:hypothetical protein
MRKNGKSLVALVSLGELHTAVASGDAEILCDMIRQGAAVDQRDAFGNTPLHRASWQGDSLLVQTLLSQGADVNALRKDGKTALDLVELRIQTRGMRPPQGLSIEEKGGNAQDVLQLLRAKNSRRATLMSTIVNFLVHQATDFLYKIMPPELNRSLEDTHKGDIWGSEKEKNLERNGLSICSASTSCSSIASLTSLGSMGSQDEPEMKRSSSGSRALATLASMSFGCFPDSAVVTNYSQYPRP